MTDTADSATPDSQSRPSTDDDEVEELQNRLTNVEEQNEELQQKVASAEAEKKKFAQRLDRIKRENEKLKQSPLFVATVEETLENQEVVIRQHGNNQEAVTELTNELHEDIEPHDRVAVDNSLNVVKALTDETDSRARVMEVTGSPDVAYSDIGGLNEQLLEVRETVEKPITEPEMFDSLGIDPPNGILLHGPPGTGKTLIAKAVAQKTDATFIQLAGSDLAQKFIGEGAKLVRDLFKLARENEPAVIFIDEIDAIGGTRNNSKTSGDAEVQRTLMQLLNEMDGFDDRGQVSIIAATNRVDMLDDAILRPGRFDRLIEVDEPDAAGREQIFQIHTRDMKLADSVDAEDLADLVEDGVTGADIDAICTEAGMFAIRNERTEVTAEDFENAYEKLQDARDGGADSTAAAGTPTAFA
jgi:proteasome regulatory subunit